MHIRNSSHRNSPIKTFTKNKVNRGKPNYPKKALS